jgi:hypothetical protein
MRMTVLAALVVALGSIRLATSAPEGKKLPLVCVSQHELVSTNAFKHVDQSIGRGILDELTVTKEPKKNVAGFRIVVSGRVISENTGFPKQGTLVFIGKAHARNVRLYALSDCDGRFRVRISSEQLSDSLYLSETGRFSLLEYVIPEPRKTAKENPNKQDARDG